VNASNDDFLFAQEAQALGYVTESQVEEAFRLQRIMAQDLKIEEHLEGILVKRGWLAEDQARRVRSRIEPEGRKNEIEGYRLLEKLGRGAMGTVYKALHVSLQRIVAIKVLHQDLAADPTQVERLKGEAKLLASLDHPNILRALDAGESNGFPFVVTEYVEGLTLREHLALHGPLPEGDALSITRALADALEKARRMGVVHRDVKPGNVLLTRQGQPKLMDLGLAKGPVDLGLTQHGATVGTPQYISPEQAQDPRKADTRSDIYSLGATLYALLTGRPPFEGTTLAEVLTKVLYETPTPPRVLNPKVSAEVGYLIERMMLKDPSLRYHTPAEVVADIDTILAGRSIMPAGFRGNWEAYLLRRRIRRWSTIGAGSLAITLVLGLGAHALLRHRDARESREDARLLAYDTLPVVRWGPEDTRQSVRDKRERVRDVLADVGDFDHPEVVELRRLGRDLDALEQCFDQWYALLGGAGEPAPADGGAVVADLLQRGDYRGALARVDDFARYISPPGSRNPVFDKLESQREAIRAASLAAWQALETGVRNARATTLEEWVEVFRRFHEQAERGFVLESQIREGVSRAGRLHVSAQKVPAALLAHEGAYEAGKVAERLRTGQLGKLFREELPQAEQTVESGVAQVWKGEALEATPIAVLLGEHGLVSLRVTAVARRVRQQVEDHATATLEEAETLRREGLLAEAFNLLDQLQYQLWQAGLPAPEAQARLAREKVKREGLEREQAAQQTLTAVFERWFAALTALGAETPAALPRAAQLDSDERRAVGARVAEELALLATGGAAIERLYARAMETLAEHQRARRRLTPQLRVDGAGSPAERAWLIVGVDAPGHSFEVAAGGGPGREPKRRSLFELKPAQIVELARQGTVLPEDGLALALGATALVPTLEVARQGDLGAALATYETAAQALEAARAPAPLRAQVQSVRARLEEQAKLAEGRAFAHHDRGKLYVAQTDFSNAFYFIKALVGETSLRNTRYFRENVAEIRKLLAVIEANIEHDNMARLLPGVKARRLPPDVKSMRGENVWEILYDLDSDPQIGPLNFAAGQGVLEPIEGPAVTPDARRTQQRLHLLRGYEEPVRDLPLVWPSIFDPAERITVEFDCYVLDRPYLLAVDVDGVHGAFLSLDPRWLPQFRMPDDVPLLEGEKRLPLAEAFGRGRGVAFHDGADWGDLSAWKAPGRPSAWPAEGRGQRLLAEDPPRAPAGPLFGFPPQSPAGQPFYRVKVVRDVKRLTLYVDEREIASEERPEWARRGTASERTQGMSNGSGAIRILTWTPMAIDNLRLTGTVRRAWIAERRAASDPAISKDASSKEPGSESPLPGR